MTGPWEKYQQADAAPSADAAAGPWTRYTSAQPQQTFDPTEGMTGLDKFRAGMGKAMTDIVRGAGQLVGAVSRDDVAESRKRDNALMNSGGAAMAGNIAGNAAMLLPAALIPGANTVAGAGAVGGVMGLLQPSTSTRETATNVGLGVLGGAGGQAIANKVPNLLQGRVDNAIATRAANAQKFGAGQAAAKEGYVIPPADLEPGMLSEAVSAFSGKIKTAQVASQRNQQVTDRLAREAIGLKAGDQLDDSVLQTIRNQAAQQGYAPIRSAGTVQADKQFFQSLDNIAATQQGAAKSFPGLGENGVVEMIDKLKQQAFDAGDAIDATRVLREAADKAYRQGDKTLGKASKQAADALEDMLERHLTASGNPDALKAFREARTLIAKTYSVQKGLNAQTGNVSAQSLAKDLQKGKPLSGELLTIAETGQAFPKATQALKEAPKALSPLDMAMAAGGAGTGNPMLLAWLGRPVARNALLSAPVQARALRQSSPVPFTQATQAALENRLMQTLLAPAGTASALQFGQ